MIRKPLKTERVQNLRNGEGFADISYLMKSEEKFSNVTFMGIVELAPKASIGFHEHINDSETYYIVQGQGLFEEKGCVEKAVESGDFCYIPKGSGHGLKNTGNDKMTILAIVSDDGLVAT